MELDELQKKVQHEFFFIKTSQGPMQEQMHEDLKNAGCLFSPFVYLIKSFTRNEIKKQQSKRNHDIYEIEADGLLKNDELKKEICSSLILLTKGEIVTEENFINYITAILYENKIRNRFVIPLEPALFAFIAYKISENGVNNFCSENE